MRPFTLSARFILAGLAFACAAPAFADTMPRTERQYLSGHGPADATAWDFEVTSGRRAVEKTTISVPSNWEQQGFGAYNYGQDENKAHEHGLYQTHFHVPAAWRGHRINLVFDGVMTDATVTLNGRSAGPVHQGGFTRFRYDVTGLIKFGDGEANRNVLTVDVAKASADPATDRAERDGDYWVFGGIYRPVFLEALPAHAIDHVAVDARADGSLTADITLGAPPGGRTDGPAMIPQRLEARVLDQDGQPLGPPLVQTVPAGGAGRVRLAGRVAGVQPWTAETPRLYTLRVSLCEGDRTLHVTDTRVGFRTFEVRDGQGLFLNGRRILLKGVNRHSFRPATGRALTRDDCYADARLIRSLNMNAVRMSHYPPDPAFLEACDELGLYVLDELSGWQHAHATPNGRRLVREMVERDVNHPSILFWDNGNEGGWNPALDGDFSLYDPQRRRVLHPWNLHGGVDTKHYVPYGQFTRLLRGPNLVMPTEILHALFDGGGGAGLADYWAALRASPFGAGLFIWDFADEAIARTDRGGRLDAHGTYGADGIVGPNFEKEGSAYTIRDVWSPVQFTAPALDAHFSGAITVRNAYDFTPLTACKFAWRLLNFTDAKTVTVAAGAATPPAVAPGDEGQLQLNLPADWRQAEALALTVTGPDGVELWTSVWPTATAATRQTERLQPRAAVGATAPTATQQGARLVLTAGPTKAVFSAQSGEIVSFSQGDRTLPLAHGPRLAFARPPVDDDLTWQNWTPTDAPEPTLTLARPALANVIEVGLADLQGRAAYAGFCLEISPDGRTWHTVFDASRRPNDGKRYIFPPQLVAAARLRNVWRHDHAKPVVQTFRIAYEAPRFPAPTASAAQVTHGVDQTADGEIAAWVEAIGGPSGLARSRWTLRADGSLRLDCAYDLNGKFLYHGVTFDPPEASMRALRWLGQGPTRVWQNRLRGTWLGWHETRRETPPSGAGRSYPEFAGYYAGVRQAELKTTGGTLVILPASPNLYLRVGTPRDDHQNTTVDFPAGNLSLLRVIPAMGSKMHPADRFGPHSQPAVAEGRQSISVVFKLQ